MTQPGRYVAPVRWLHWIMVALIATIATLGIWITGFEPKDEAFKLRLYNIHESLGATVFAFALIRLLLRWRNPPPPLAPDTPPLVRLAAGSSHAALYALMILMPAIGFLDTNAWGFPLFWFGIAPIPSPIGRQVALAPWLSWLHWIGAITLGLVVAAHLGGVAYHMLIRRDGLLRRML